MADTQADTEQKKPREPKAPKAAKPAPDAGPKVKKPRVPSDYVSRLKLNSSRLSAPN